MLRADSVAVRESAPVVVSLIDHSCRSLQGDTAVLQSLILPGISFGLSATAIPGPLQAFLISTTLAQGWRRSIVIICSPLITDAPIIVLVLFILGHSPEALLPFIQIAGGLFLLYLAWNSWKGYAAGDYVGKKKKTDDPAAAPHSRAKILRRAVLMNFLSPGPYLFWGTINGRLLLQGLDQSIWHGLAFLIAFYGTFLGGLALVVMLFSRVGQLDSRISRRVMLFTILLMAFFGGEFIVQGITAIGMARG